MRVFKLSICCFFLVSSIFAQPSWVNKPPAGYLNDFFVGRGIGFTKTEATQKAFEDAVISIMRNFKVTINYSEDNTIISEHRNYNDSIQMDIVRKSVQELRFDGESRTINQLKQVETFYESNQSGFEAFVLLSLPKKNPVSPPTAFSPIWRSALLPGWGQLYRGDTFKGITFFTLTLASITSGLVFDQLSNEASIIAQSARTQARRDFYNNEKKTTYTYSMISFVGAGIFYVWSLVDSIIVKSDNLYVNLESGNSYVSINMTLRVILEK